ncbi:NAD-dependent epimerase/dehydratase family protein [Novosphingobium sp. MMS21-SN21R]|uniref:NAD-dependent epimerase/dehydratase family protein n=1 Tax=Novosphingobium sp. MMS21-SN21R TaxID=2969298 RepID=UPI002888D9FE|nr:NAD-dependent epimerase/dehydratase family protein [Novosphingobium sp. MMS21-SN21R]MDT0509830.1 NAD-dependent epimerase/dehydratase family protein [Novosphingobium sp. MMS21-SN21R]
MAPVAKQTLLVAGASGVIGTSAVEHFAQLPEWEVIALSRRPPRVAAGCDFRHVPVDLTDSGACSKALAALPPVTHLVYAAVAEAPGLVTGWHDAALMARNGAMFENILHPLAASGSLQHVTLLQGAKAYGAHVHPITVPLREDGPRDPHPNFYWLHEDALRNASAQAAFTFTIWRPQVLIGTAPGAAMNPLLPIAAYAAICQERGLPFCLPGAGDGLLELVDSQLLAEAMHWSMTCPNSTKQTFNITNGDIFVLRHAWNSLAEAMHLPVHGDATTDFVAFFAEESNQQAWTALAERHRLIEPSLSAFLGQSHHYLDLLISPRLAGRVPVLLSTIKLRQAGFAGCRDSLRTILSALARMADLRLVPPLLRG